LAAASIPETLRPFLCRPEIDGALVGAGMQTASGFKGVLDAFYDAGSNRLLEG